MSAPVASPSVPSSPVEIVAPDAWSWADKAPSKDAAIKGKEAL